MTAYIIRRLFYMIPVVFGVLLVTFCLFTVVGGDISQQIAGKNADAQTIAEIRHEYGFDKPLFVGHKPLAGDDALWEAEKEDYIQQLVEQEQTQLQEAADKEVQKTGNKGKADPVPEPIIEEFKAKKEWLSDQFWQRP